MAAGDPRMHVEVQPHHEQRKICASRAKYREGRKPRAVRVYTINQESRYVLVQGVPAIGVMKELVEQFALFGSIEEYNVLDEYPAEEFTEVYLIKFQRLQSARVAKRKLDERSFFGGLLHVCYAPEFESVQETREKLQERRRYVARATSSDKDHPAAYRRREEGENSSVIPIRSAVSCTPALSGHSSVQCGAPPAPSCAPPPWVTPDYTPTTSSHSHVQCGAPPAPCCAPPPWVTPDYTPASSSHSHVQCGAPLAPSSAPPPWVTPDYTPTTSSHSHVQCGAPPAPSCAPPPWVTPDYTPASSSHSHVQCGAPPAPSCSPPPWVIPDYRHEDPPLHSSGCDSKMKSPDHPERKIDPAQGRPSIARFMPRTTQLQERQRRREERTRLSVLLPQSQEIIIGPKLPEIPKLDLADHSLNITADLIRGKLKEVSAPFTKTGTDPPATDPASAPPVKQRRRI